MARVTVGLPADDLNQDTALLILKYYTVDQQGYRLLPVHHSKPRMEQSRSFADAL